MKKAPPDMQVSNLLLFLAEALQTDPEIQRWTQSSPKDIVSHVANYQPLQRADGKSWLMVSQLPALCFNTVSASHRRRGDRWGRTLTGNLWYVFNTPQSESADIHGLTKAERIKSLMDWRINYWLHRQKLPRADGGVFDLQSETKIRLVTVGDSDFFNEGNVEGLRISVQLEHYWAPYTEDDITTIDLYSVSITERDSEAIPEVGGPSPAPLTGEATIDV